MDTGYTRHFLDWSQPSLNSAAEWILTQFQHANNLDLSTIHIVLPGQRAARVLLGNLIDLCETQGVIFIPPLFLTPLEIPATVLGVPGVHASKITRRLAWIEALRSCNPNELSTLIPDPPEPDQWDQWTGIGKWIGTVASELCDAGMRMGDVASHAESILDESESQRWSLLGEIQSRYECILAELGVVDDRLVALDRVLDTDSTPNATHRLILIGMPELGSTPRRAIEQAGCTIDSLIFAPDELADRFDDLGCVSTSQWLNTIIDIDEQRIMFEENPSSMCEQALAQLALRADPIDTSSCVIGLADETLIGSLRRHASMAGPNQGIQLHAPAGHSASITPPGQLLSLIQSYLSTQSFDTLTNLIRHPDFERALDQHDQSKSDSTRPPAWWLKAIDRIRQDHVLTSSTRIPSGVKDKLAIDVRFVIDSTEKLLESLIQTPGTTSTLNDWSIKLAQSLERIYQDSELDPQSDHDRSIIEGLGAIRAVFDEINDADQLGQPMPTTTAHAAIGLILDRLGQTMLPELLNRDSIETLGWLELMLDPSPVCIVVGMSESCVPGAVTHDPLLPGALRNLLGMTTNDDRLARDTYLMTAINASRDAVFMCARNGDKNDPITPSRLLLRTSGKALANRITRFVNPATDSPSNHRLAIDSNHGSTDLFRKTLRVAQDYVAPTSMRVTDFDTYLRSPAQWYLEKSLKLEELNTTARELSPRHMGTLIHSILEAFGKDSSMRDLDNPKTINDALLHLLDQESKAQFGTKPAAAVVVQTQLLQYRLDWFANQQAQRRRDGWTITHTEWSPDESAMPSLLVDGIPMELRGKIDRIDIHDNGDLAIIDYKTGKITDARRAHLKKEQWIKLQLPLYRSLVKDLFGDQELALGYAGLPASQGESVWSFADWDEDELHSADQAACDVVRSIRSMAPGDPIGMGDSPPDAGILGFISGERFDSGGHEIQHPDPAETEVGV